MSRCEHAMWSISDAAEYYLVLSVKLNLVWAKLMIRSWVAVSCGMVNGRCPNHPVWTRHVCKKGLFLLKALEGKAFSGAAGNCMLSRVIWLPRVEDEED